jgi:glycosyltransferase involved in cell wall biosynthesis
MNRLRSAAKRVNPPELISVVLPVLNGERYLGEQLAALAHQTYARPWEVVIVDNGCTDGTLAVVERWGDRLPDVRIADASDLKGLNHARNIGSAAARGDFLAFCDADDVVSPGWLAGLATAAERADILGGVGEIETLNGRRAFPSRTGSQPGGVRTRLGYLPSVSGGNCGVWTDVARTLRWDESFVYAGSDIEFSWRAVLASFRVDVAPGAVIRVRQRTDLRSLATQWFLYGKSDAQLFRAFRGRGMRRSSLAAALKETLALALRLPDIVRSPIARRTWLTLAARRVGRIAGSIQHRVFFP